MSMPPDSADNDNDLFRSEFTDIKPLEQDKVVPDKKIVRQQKQRLAKRTVPEYDRQTAASFTFSDIYQANLSQDGPMRYCREDTPTHTLKRLRRGDFYPELVLDLHGLTRENAKLELSALIHTARKEHIDCVSLVHGIGQGVLKNALPHYLVQHPHVLAFHQAPLEYGGHGALLVLIETEETRLFD